MRQLFTVLLLLAAHSSLLAVEFTSLSRTTPVSLTHTAAYSAYVDVSLSLDATHSAIAKGLYVRVRYIVGNDTLHDLLTINGNTSGLVKQMLLKEGELLTAQLFLHNGETTEVDSLVGSFRVNTNTALTVSKDIVGATFPGRVWVREHHPLFRVKFDAEGPRNVVLQVHFDGNYEYDALHFKVKVISPEQGILFLPYTVKVTDDATLNFNEKSVKVTLDGVNFSYPGSYYIQVMHTMGGERVNGIHKVSYEVVNQ